MTYLSRGLFRPRLIFARINGPNFILTNYYNISSLSRKNTILAILYIYIYIYIYIYLASDPKWQGTNGTLEIGPMQGTCQRGYKLLGKNISICVTKITMKECMRGKKEMKEVYKQRKNERRVDKHTHTER